MWERGEERGGESRMIGGNLRQRDRLEDLDVVGRIILNVS
jgi:hypothetical protein